MAHVITATEDCVLRFTLYGAAGGNGGGDGGAGAKGSPGDKVYVEVNALKNQQYYVSVGSVGANGLGAPSRITGTGGGAGGEALVGFSGGKGGNTGPSGWSGAGGGGGGATVLYTYDEDNKLRYIAVAAGGAGGGGGGARSGGTPYKAVSRLVSVAPTYYTNVKYSSWGSLLNQYGVIDGLFSFYSKGSKTLTWYIYIPEDTHCYWHSSADNYASLYLNDHYIQYVPSFTQTTIAEIILYKGMNKLSAVYTNTGGPAGYAGYISVKGTGDILWSSRSANNLNDLVYNMGRGGAGQYHAVDGGGAGGGGGGFYGGAGGIAAGGGQGGDHGAESGYPGLSFVPTGPFSGTPAITDQWLYDRSKNTSITVFGAANAGSNGSYTVSSLSTGISYKNNSTGWKSVTELNYRISNTQWQEINSVYYREGNNWVPLFKKDTFTITTTTELRDSVSGAMIPLDPPPPPTIVYSHDSGSYDSYSGGDSVGIGDSADCSSSDGESCGPGSW